MNHSVELLKLISYSKQVVTSVERLMGSDINLDMEQQIVINVVVINYVVIKI